MKLLLIILSIIFLTNCSKPKTVLICGDHICVNKSEAEQYFEENLTIEVKIIDKKERKELDLVELNLSENNKGKRKVELITKKDTKKNLKILTKEEKIEIKKNIKKKKKDGQLTKKISNKNKRNQKNLKNNVNKSRKEVVDICTILEKCSIDEISKYLIEEGKKKGFPDITKKQ